MNNTTTSHSWYCYHFHQIRVVLFINSSRTWVVFPLSTASAKNTTIYETNYCHSFAAIACTHSTHIKQVESLRIVRLVVLFYSFSFSFSNKNRSVVYKHPGYNSSGDKPLNISLHIYSTGISPRYRPPDINPLDISTIDISSLDYKPLDISPQI